jgi:hypothetical protein
MILYFAFIIIFIFLFINDPYHIVVSRYKEDTTWIEGYPYVKIYNKHSGSNKLPNIGRESHTYLHYVVENYDNLPDRVFFTQGDMTGHESRTVDEFIYSKDKITGGFFSHKGPNAFPKGDGRVDWPQLHKADMDFFDWFSKYIDENIDMRTSDLRWSAGAIFSVRKDMILSRPKKFYEDLLSQFPDHSDPEIGHYFERAWYYIFNCHK